MYRLSLLLCRLLDGEVGLHRGRLLCWCRHAVCLGWRCPAGQESVIEQLSRWKPYRCVDRPRGDRRRELLSRLDREVLHVSGYAVCRCGLTWLSVKLGLEFDQHLCREGASTLPDRNHVLQLWLLLGRNAFHDVVKQCRHELRHAFDSSGICAGFSSSL